MLSFCLITRDAGPLLRNALQRLALAMAPDEDITVIDCGSEDDTLPELASFLEPRPGELIRLDAPGPDRREAMTLAWGHARHPYLLCLDACDLVHPDGIGALRAQLLDKQPQVLVAQRNWWLGTPDLLLPSADTSRIGALGPTPTTEELLTLTPDPRRLVLHADLATRLTDRAHTEGGMALWEHTLGAAEHTALCSEPAWASPLPDHPAAPMLAAVTDRQNDPAGFLRALNWADDALYLTGPDEAPALLAAAQPLLERLDPAQPLPAIGPITRILEALRDEGRAMGLAQLVLELSNLERQRNRALADAIGRLRADLDLALPGPEYLRQLYDRIRAR